MKQQQLNQLIAAGGMGSVAVEHIEHLQKTIDIAAKCMGEKQIENELLKDFLRDCAKSQCEDTAANAMQIINELGVRL